MAELPSVTFTDEQAGRILTAFGGEDAYTSWLHTRIVNYVLEQEQTRMAADALAEQREALAALRLSLSETA
jgi:hypothetical protein